MRFFAASCLAFGVLLATRAAHAQRAYGAAGPRTIETRTLAGGAASGTRVVVPTTGGPAPLVVASHGWSASGDHQIGWAEHFARWGFVVAVPTFPNSFSPDTAVNARIVADLVTRLEGADAATFGVAKGRFALEGHSAGGLATTVAADTLAPAAVVLFDPVDRDGAGAAAYAKLCSPVLALFAQPGSCNAQAAWKGFAPGARGDVLALDVAASTHCDGENAPRALCGPFCGGGASADRQAVYAHYATAFLLAELKDDAAAKQALGDAAVAADAAVALVARKTSACTPGEITPDAGIAPAPPSTPPPAGTSDGPPPVAPVAPGGGGDGGGEGSDGAGGGCAATSASRPDAMALLAGALGLAIVARARKRLRARR